MSTYAKCLCGTFLFLPLVANLLHAGDGSFAVTPYGLAEQRIVQALEDDTTLEFVEAPLAEVVQFLKDQHKIEIQIDARALDDVGIGTDTPVTRNLKGISLRSTLRLILRELDLTYAIRKEVLLISTPEECETDTVTQVFDVSRLLREDESADEIADVLRYAFAPAQPTDEKPRPGLDFVAYRNLVIVRARRNLFPAVEAFLTKMDVGLNGPSKAETDARTDPSALPKPFLPDSRFAIAGHIDWNGDGVDDLPLLAHLIRSFGGTIEAIQQQDGRVVGRLTKDTDYLVRGERPTERNSAAFLESYTSIVEAASRLELETLSADRLFDYYNRAASQQARPKAAASPATKPQDDDPFGATTSDGDPFGDGQ